MYYSSPGFPDPPYSMKAVAVMMGSPAFPSIRGTVRFAQTTAGVVVRADIVGLPVTPAGFFGFHLHAGRCGRQPVPRPPQPGAGGPP
jgi:Cu/Zn superoxide dismutase